MEQAIVRDSSERVNVRSSIPFFLLQLLPLLAFVTGVTTTALVLLAVTFFGRMFFITAGYHRYFAHRSYKLGRVAQFVMAFGGGTACQKGVLWWAGHHRRHHQFADTERDLHSPRKGFWWSHVGWILCDKYSATDTDAIKDFARYPELRFLDKHDWIPMWALGVTCFLIGGWSGLIIGFFLSNVLLWHSTFTVNSLAHVFGRRRYDTVDTSRNNIFVALLPRHDTRNFPKHRRSLQRRRHEIPLPIHLLHRDPNLQRTVNLTILHQIPPHDALLPISVQLTLLHILR